MEERVARLGGVFRVTSGNGRGTTVALELPLPDSIGPAAQETRPFLTA
jgi:hypothetical protein